MISWFVSLLVVLLIIVIAIIDIIICDSNIFVFIVAALVLFFLTACVHGMIFGG